MGVASPSDVFDPFEQRPLILQDARLEYLERSGVHEGRGDSGRYW